MASVGESQVVDHSERRRKNIEDEVVRGSCGTPEIIRNKHHSIDCIQVHNYMSLFCAVSEILRDKLLVENLTCIYCPRWGEPIRI